MPMFLLLFIWTARHILRRINGASVAVNVPHLTRSGSLWAAVALGLIAACCGGGNANADEHDSSSEDLNALPTLRVAEVRSSQQDATMTPQLREGTLITSTVGRIVMMGRRWAFVRTTDQNPPDADVVLRALPAPATDEKPRPKRLGLASLPAHARIQFHSIAMRDRQQTAKGG
ncbi:MAG: hypothetical protein ACR2NZ_21340, partial [Rubripirellula sp.]